MNRLISSLLKIIFFPKINSRIIRSSSQQVRISIRTSGRRAESDFISVGTCSHERQRDACAARRSEGADKKLPGNGSASKLHEIVRRGEDRRRSERRGVRASQQEAGGSHTPRRVVRGSAAAK